MFRVRGVGSAALKINSRNSLAPGVGGEGVPMQHEIYLAMRVKTRGGNVTFRGEHELLSDTMVFINQFWNVNCHTNRRLSILISNCQHRVDHFVGELTF
jgi:hypothetical protein